MAKQTDRTEQDRTGQDRAGQDRTIGPMGGLKDSLEQLLSAFITNPTREQEAGETVRDSCNHLDEG